MTLGADTNLPATNSQGAVVSPIYLAASSGHEDTVRELLSAGARLDVGISPLETARRRGHQAVLGLLEGAGEM